MLLASAMVAVGLTIFGLSVLKLAAHNPQMAQATQPLQSSPPAPRRRTPHLPSQSPAANARPRRRRARTSRRRGTEGRCCDRVAAGSG